MKNLVFENQNVEVIVLNEEALFNAKDVAKVLEMSDVTVRRHIQKMSSKQVVKLKNSDVQNMNIRKLNNAGESFLTEAGVYKLAFRSNKESAERFADWVAEEVLPTIRKTGCYITEDASDEAIDYQKLYGSRRIRKTFTNASDPGKEWEQYLELSKNEAKKGRINNEDKIKAANIVLDVLSKKLESDIASMKASQVIAIQELTNDIKSQVIEWGNRRYGARLGHVNKQLKEAKEVVKDFRAYFEQEELGWTEEIPVDYHPFSENCMYEAIDEGKMVKTRMYNRWLREFPLYQLPTREMLEEIGIDFTKPIDVRVGFRALEKFDKQNFIKPFLDIIFNYFQADDRIVSDLAMIDLGVCDEYKDGGFVFQIRNKVIA